VNWKSKESEVLVIESQVKFGILISQSNCSVKPLRGTELQICEINVFDLSLITPCNITDKESEWAVVFKIKSLLKQGTAIIKASSTLELHYKYTKMRIFD